MMLTTTTTTGATTMTTDIRAEFTCSICYRNVYPYTMVPFAKPNGRAGRACPLCVAKRAPGAPRPAPRAPRPCPICTPTFTCELHAALEVR